MTKNIEVYNGTTPIRNWVRQIETFAEANEWIWSTWHLKPALFLRGPPVSWYCLQDVREDPKTYWREALFEEFEDPDSFYENMMKRKQGPT